MVKQVKTSKRTRQLQHSKDLKHFVHNFAFSALPFIWFNDLVLFNIPPLRNKQYFQWNYRHNFNYSNNRYHSKPVSSIIASVGAKYAIKWLQYSGLSKPAS